jgi:septum formation protein
LASTSTYRRALVERLGVPFRCEAPRVDEDSLKQPDLAPRVLAEMLAEAKAQSIADAFPNAVVIGSDQVACCEGMILGKPGTAERAIEQLLGMAGRTHELITAMVVVHRGTVQRHTDVTRLHMRRLTRDAIARYVAADCPLDCAGSYKLESRGIVLFEQIESADHSAITGLPLMALTSILRELSFAIP